MATTDNNLQVINSMTEEMLSSLKDSDGKIPSLANQLIMTDEEDANLSCIRTEVVYDMTSSDSAKNWGYTSGIKNGVAVTGKDFSKYEKLIVYANIASSVNGFAVIDLTTQVYNNNKYYGSNVITMGYESSSYLFVCGGEVNTDKTSFTASSHLRYVSNGNTLTSDSYRIYKIEGVLKEPAVIYTGNELFAGNGISIESGVVSTKGWTLVYTNNSTSSGFAGQTLSLNLSNYNEIMVYCVATNAVSTPNLCVIAPVGNTNALHMRIAYWDSSASKVRQVARQITTVSSTGITFGDGFFDGSTSASLNACIPKYIYAR